MRIFTIYLITQHFYTHQIDEIYVMGDYLLLFLCAGDVAACGAFDRAIQIAIIDRYLSEGVRDALLLGDDSFYNVLISTVNLRSYNG